MGTIPNKWAYAAMATRKKYRHVQALRTEEGNTAYNRKEIVQTAKQFQEKILTKRPTEEHEGMAGVIKNKLDPLDREGQRARGLEGYRDKEIKR